MRVTDDILKSVCFIAIQNLDTGHFEMKGTAFFVVCDYRTPSFLYVVTAKHVINGIDNIGVDNVYLLVNMKDGSRSAVRTETTKWIYSEDKTVDIGIYPFGLTDEFDHLNIPLSKTLTHEIVKEYDIGIGEEVVITGLFSHHHGIEKLIPILRVGNLASFPENKIQTRTDLMDAILIEARSIGGLSGSPVFVNLGNVRIIDGELKKSNVNNSELYLVGLIYGHFHDKFLEGDEQKEYIKLNTGIAIVTPISKLFDMFSQNTIIDFEKGFL